MTASQVYIRLLEGVVPYTRVFALAVLSMVVLAANRSAQGEISVGGFVSFFTAMAMLFSPLKRLTSINGNLQRGIAAAMSVFSVIDQEPEADHGTVTMGRARGELGFNRIRFTYEGQEQPAVTDFDLQVAAGETVALVGPSGSGKTTIASLIARFYELETGTITLDGVDVRELTLYSLRQNVALVSQDIVLFNDTIAANIAYGPLADSSEKAVLAAAEAAHATEFIDSLPQGMRTRIGNQGVRLSGGQRQRLAIARAFLKNAPVLILDEATSSLDTGAERHIQAAIERLRRERTTLIIAHRLSSVERADRIVVMADGAMVDIGTRQALLERSNLYAALYRFQFTRDAAQEPVSDAR